jgi:Zn/Cd-binding protein ZinT
MATQTELKDALKTAAEKVAQYVEDAAEMSVETRYVEMGAASFDNAKIAARTVVKLDGDSQTVLPMRKGEAGAMTVDAAVFEMHQQNVQAAIDYRAKMMNSLLSLLRPQG